MVDSWRLGERARYELTEWNYIDWIIPHNYQLVLAYW